MELILLEKVPNLGNLGDKVKVKPGFGRNYLVPTGKAVTASKDNVARFEVMRAELEKTAQDRRTIAETRAAALADVIVTLTAIASEEGKLYGSIGPREISEILAEMGHEVSKRELIMGEGVIRAVGEFEILVHLHADVELPIKVVVKPE